MNKQGLQTGSREYSSLYIQNYNNTRKYIRRFPCFLLNIETVALLIPLKDVESLILNMLDFHLEKLRLLRKKALNSDNLTLNQ